MAQMTTTVVESDGSFFISKAKEEAPQANRGGLQRPPTPAPGSEVDS